MKPVAFVFPGQGSQSVGMLDAWGDHPAVRDTLQEASDALGEDIGTLIAQGPKEALALTTNTQPVMLVAGVACWRAWRAEGGALPAAVAGHSLGEYSALVAAEALTLAQAVPLVRLRAAAMQEAVPVGTGAMAAILGMEASKVITGCAEVTTAMGQNGTEVVEAVNFNDPVQTVIAGSKAAVDKACEVLKGMGAKRALPLPVSAPFHSSLMKPAADAMAEELAKIPPGAPKVPLIANVTASAVSDGKTIGDLLIEQVTAMVRWRESCLYMKEQGVDTLVELGSGKVLSGLARRIDSDLEGVAVNSPADVETLIKSL